MKNLSRYFPWAILVVAVVFLIVRMIPAKDPPEQMHLVAFGRLVVQEEGRTKPLDSLARTSLLIISGKSTFADGDGKTQPAIRWLLDVMTSGPAFDVRRQIVKEYRTTEAELAPFLPAGAFGKPQKNKDVGTDEDEVVIEQARAFLKKKIDVPDGQHQKLANEILKEQKERLAELFDKLKKTTYPLPANTYRVFRIDNDQVQTLMGVERGRSGMRYSFAELEPGLAKLETEAERADGVRKSVRPIPLFEGKVLELAEHVQMFRKLQGLGSVYPGAPETSGERWINLQEAFNQRRETKHMNASAGAFFLALEAYADQDTAAFNKAVAEYQKAVDKAVPTETSDAEIEAFFNHFEPFYLCAILYVCVFLLACCSFLGWTEPMQRAAFWLAVLTLVLHTWALGMRMYLQGRPPVTNLYSSAVFIGWGAIVFGLVLESIFKNGLGLIGTAVIGALTMMVAIFLAGTGDTLARLQAVLDTNFWLATHVICISLGYVATFVAGVLGWLYIVFGLFTRHDRSFLRSLSQMIYGIVCFAMVLSFTGTVLGGIWADQSWGRFWGWDSKENGALIIVIWNALVLHARWAGMVKPRGVAILTVVGNIVTAWSWFGTNQLGVGLHAYGFNDQLARGLVSWWALNFVFIGMGVVPLRYWRSFQPQPHTAPTPDAGGTSGLGTAHA